MMSEEYVVTLIVECDSAPAAELWLVVEQRAQHAANCHTQPSAEVVQNHLST